MMIYTPLILQEWKSKTRTTSSLIGFIHIRHCKKATHKKRQPTRKGSEISLPGQPGRITTLTIKNKINLFLSFSLVLWGPLCLVHFCATSFSSLAHWFWHRSVREWPSTAAFSGFQPWKHFFDKSEAVIGCAMSKLAWINIGAVLFFKCLIKRGKDNAQLRSGCRWSFKTIQSCKATRD